MFDARISAASGAGVGTHPTAGGYAKIATVISADLGKLGQIRAAGAVRFAEASVVAEAVDHAEVPTTVQSRLFRIPVWYDDPRSQALARRYDVPNNLEFVAEANGIAPDEAIRRHGATRLRFGSES